jgi:hypothetical protein
LVGNEPQQDYLYGVWGRSSGDVYVVGWDITEAMGFILHRTERANLAS